jgi:hypothetical protein
VKMRGVRWLKLTKGSACCLILRKRAGCGELRKTTYGKRPQLKLISLPQDLPRKSETGKPQKGEKYYAGYKGTSCGDPDFINFHF